MNQDTKDKLSIAGLLAMIISISGLLIYAIYLSNVENALSMQECRDNAINRCAELECKQTYKGNFDMNNNRAEIKELARCRAKRGDSLEVQESEFLRFYNCTRGENDVLAMETFSGGQHLDLDSTRYPIKSFCFYTPATITTQKINLTNSIYTKLGHRQKLYIPLDQTWTLFYYFDNTNKIVSNSCDYSKEYYDVDTTACIAQRGEQ